MTLFINGDDDDSDLNIDVYVAHWASYTTSLAKRWAELL